MPLGFRPLGAGPLGSGATGGLQAANLAVTSPVIGTPLLEIDLLVMGDAALDFGLSRLNLDANQIYICSQRPTTYTEAISTYALGVKDFGAARAFDPIVAGSPGRRITSVAINNGIITSSGAAVWWAAVDSSQARLLATGSFLGSRRTVTAGNHFNLTPLTITLPG